MKLSWWALPTLLYYQHCQVVIYDEWDRIIECSIDVPSGKIVVAGCSDYYPDAVRISVEPGIYQARVFYGELDSLSEDGCDGNDKYKIALWLGETINPKVIKK